MTPKPLLILALGTLALVAGWLAPVSSQAQAGADSSVLDGLAAEIATQQATIVANQTKIDAKLATIAEDVRQARLFTSRAGGHK